MQIKFKKLYHDSVPPRQGTPGSAGFDLSVRKIRGTQGKVIYYSGIAVEIPRGYVGLMFPRSSVVKTDQRLANAVGVIDSDYCGEITGVFDVTRVTPFFQALYEPKIYHPGERFAQLVIVPIPEVEYIEVEELTPTERGAGGYGSTGK